MVASLSSAVSSCMHPTITSASNDSKHSSLSCADKLFVGLKPKSSGAYGIVMPNVSAGFHSRVHLSLSVANKKATSARIKMMPIGTPRVPYRTPGEGTWQWVDLWNALYRDRVIFIGQHIDEEFSNQVLATMLYLDSIESSKKLYLYINGPGGDLTPCMSIFDTMQSLKSPVGTQCVGFAYNLAGFLLARKIAVPLVCHGHSRPVVDLFYSPVTPDGYFLISASKDSSPMLRNGETGDWIGTFEGHKGAVWSCCLDTNALRAASGSADFTAKIWDALTGDELHSFEHKHIVKACAFSEDTHQLLTGGFEKMLRIFDLNRPDAPPREVKESPGSVRTVAWLHSDQTILTSCSEIGGVRLLDLRSNQIIQTLETKSSVTSAEVSKDGRYITTADGSTVKFWDANHFGLMKCYDMPCKVESASIEPKFGNKFIVGGEDMWVHLFDFFTGEEISCNKGHHGPIHCVKFSPEGESYASGSEDGTIRIWKMNSLDGNEILKSSEAEIGVDEAVQKVQTLHISKDGSAEEEEVPAVV